MTHGVIASGKLVYSIAHDSGKQQLYTVPTTDINDVTDILTLMSEHDLTTVWVCPGDVLNHWTAVQAQDATGMWDIRYTAVRSATRGQPDILQDVSARKLEGSFHDKRQLYITWPQTSQYRWEETDPVACLGAVHYLGRALGIEPHHNPGILGRHLMQETNSTASRPNWLAALTFDPFGLPEDIGFDLSYAPGLDPTMLSTRQQYIHAWDKNSAYLGACSSVELGVGNPFYLGPTDFKEDHDGTMAEWYNGKRPGYWRITGVSNTLLPIDPLYTGQEWVTTPLLKLLYAMGANPRIVEAWVWPEHHRVLDKFATTLWAARQALKNDTATYRHQGARELAYYSIKRVATAGVGMLANKNARQYARQWYRPDWRATVTEEAKCRMVYKILQVHREYNIMPLAVATDAVAYLSETPNPLLCMADMFGNPDKLGGWKVLGSAPASYGALDCFRYGKSGATMMRDFKRYCAASMKDGELL